MLQLRWEALGRDALPHNLVAGDASAYRKPARHVAGARSPFCFSFTKLMKRTASKLGGCPAPFATCKTERPPLIGPGLDHFVRVERTLAAI